MILIAELQNHSRHIEQTSSSSWLTSGIQIAGLIIAAAGVGAALFFGVKGIADNAKEKAELKFETIRTTILNDLDEIRRHLIMVLFLIEQRKDVDQYLSAILRNALQYHHSPAGPIKYDPIASAEEIERFKNLLNIATSQDLEDLTNEFLVRVNKEESRIRNLSK